MIALENNKTWFFFRVHGLHIKKNKNWRNFMFGDSTVANAEDIKSYIICKDFGHEIDHKLLRSEFPDNQSFIVVSITRVFSNANAEEIKEDAIKRANEIIALIYFYFLYASSLKVAITLDNEIYHSTDSSIQSYNSTGYSGISNNHTKGEFVTYTPNFNFTFSTKELIKELNKPLYSNITKIIIDKTNKHYKEVSNSLSNFYKTSNVPSPVTQQLGSVTSIELLLKDSVKYDNIEKRVKALLGKEDFTAFVEHKESKEKRSKEKESEGVFEKRHSIIHDAAACNYNDAFRAMNLYCMVLLGYSKICQRFFSKKEVCVYLDLIYKYKYDEDLKSNDTLSILKDYDKAKISFDAIDWVTRNLINHFGICKSGAVLVKSNFIATVHCLKQIRNLELKEAYKKVCSCMYYQKIPFSSFADFEVEYKDEDNTMLFSGLQRTIDRFIV